MQVANTQWLVKRTPHFAKAQPHNPVLKAILDACEAGIVVPSILKANLAAIPDVSIVTDDAEHASFGYRKLVNCWRVLVWGPAKYHPDFDVSKTDEQTEPPGGTATGERRTLLAAGVHRFPESDLKRMAEAGLTDEQIDRDSQREGLLLAALGYVRECQHAEDRAAGLPKRTFGLGSPAAGVKP